MEACRSPLDDPAATSTEGLPTDPASGLEEFPSEHPTAVNLIHVRVEAAARTPMSSSLAGYPVEPQEGARRFEWLLLAANASGAVVTFASECGKNIGTSVLSAVAFSRAVLVALRPSRSPESHLTREVERQPVAVEEFPSEQSSTVTTVNVRVDSTRPTPIAFSLVGYYRLRRERARRSRWLARAARASGAPVTLAKQCYKEARRLALSTLAFSRAVLVPPRPLRSPESHLMLEVRRRPVAVVVVAASVIALASSITLVGPALTLSVATTGAQRPAAEGRQSMLLASLHRQALPLSVGVAPQPLPSPPASPPLPVPPQSTRGPSTLPDSGHVAAGGERRAIGTVLSGYRDAWSTMDVQAVAAVWPNVDVGVLRRQFASVVDQNLEFDACQVSIGATIAVASCTGVIESGVNPGRRRPFSTRASWQFTLEKAGSRWQIRKVSTRPTWRASD
jgi:hypothetical protein